jgi:Cysteine-rich secretory protein family
MRRCRVIVLALLAPLVACSSSSDGGGSGTDAADSGALPTDSSAVDGDGQGDGAPDDAASDASALSDPCITKVNAYRATVGAPPLARNTDNEACAADQARKGATDLKTTGKTVFHAYFGQCKEGYQNECWYSADSPDAVIDWCLDAFWKEGPPETGINHYSVMADPASTTMACGFFHMEGGGYWMTQDYYR